MKDKKFLLIKYTLILLSVFGLIFIYNKDNIVSKREIRIAKEKVTKENILSAANEYITKNNDLFSEYFKSEDMEYRIDTKTLVDNKLISNNDGFIGYVKIKNDSYEYVKTDKLLLNEIINDKNYVESSHNDKKAFDLKYVFTGENPNNYIKFEDKLYRIIGITNSNNLKLISVDNYNNITWGLNNKINWFDGEKLPNETSSKGIFYVGYVRSETNDIDQIIKNEKRNNIYTVGTPTYYGYYAFVNISDIILASNSCQFSNILDISKDTCNSYLINMLTNTYTSNTLEGDSVYKIDKNNKLVASTLGDNIMGKKVIFVNGLSKYISGDGSIKNPYIFED